MKKYFYFLALLLALMLPTLSNAQLGVKAGWQRSTMFQDEDNIADPLNSFYVGLVRDRPLGSGMFSINVAAEYLQGGWRIDDNSFRKIHYGSAPIGLRATFGPVFVQVGPTLNFRFGEKYTLLGQDALTDDNEADWFDLLGHLNIGVNIGNFFIDASYTYGFLEVTDDGLKNAYLQFGGGFYFGGTSTTTTSTE